MQLFYLPEVNEYCQLDEIESRHCVKVLRLKAGDSIQLTDGKGFFYTAEITNDNPKSCQLQITSKDKEIFTRNYYLHIAIAPTKNIDRFEWFLEKATEIGIDEITPLITENSERKQIKPERLVKIIVSAMKQSLKASLPKLNELVTFEKFMKNSDHNQKFIAHCYEKEKPALFPSLSEKGKYTILIGPEGDFSMDEVELAIKSDYKPISLGNARLRTETAGIVACHTASLKNI